MELLDYSLLTRPSPGFWLEQKLGSSQFLGCRNNNCQCYELKGLIIQFSSTHIIPFKGVYKIEVVFSNCTKFDETWHKYCLWLVNKPCWVAEWTFDQGPRKSHLKLGLQRPLFTFALGVVLWETSSVNSCSYPLRVKNFIWLLIN